MIRHVSSLTNKKCLNIYDSKINLFLFYVSSYLCLFENFLKEICHFEVISRSKWVFMEQTNAFVFQVTVSLVIKSTFFCVWHHNWTLSTDLFRYKWSIWRKKHSFSPLTRFSWNEPYGQAFEHWLSSAVQTEILLRSYLKLWRHT